MRAFFSHYNFEPILTVPLAYSNKKLIDARLKSFEAECISAHVIFAIPIENIFTRSTAWHAWIRFKHAGKIKVATYI